MDAQDWLDRAFIDHAVMELRPDYTAVIIVAEGLRPGPSDDASDALLATAQEQARKALAGGTVAELAPVVAWRLGADGLEAARRDLVEHVSALNPGARQAWRRVSGARQQQR